MECIESKNRGENKYREKFITVDLFQKREKKREILIDCILC